jgi:pSer/pThr/pTyr-binding forkhead associated (FHA) protein
LPSAVARAKITSPNGIDIRLSGKGKVIGRGDLARALNLDDLGLISRRHFEIKLDDEQFYIEDLGSANGTHLNGKDISGKGPVGLDDGDIIEPAGAVQLKFHLL